MKKITILIFILLIMFTGCSSNNNKVIDEPNTAIDSNETNDGEDNETDEKENSEISFKKLKREPIVIDDTTGFKPKGYYSESEAKYTIDLNMNHSGEFEVTTNIIVKNLSSDQWSEVMLYFIPNSFTPEYKPEIVPIPSTVTIDSLELNGDNTEYQLKNDTLKIPLAVPLATNNEITIEMNYQFTLPQASARFNQSGENYYLAQWYPMLATYNSGWNIEEYNIMGESYFTDFSDFIVNFNIPEGYTLFSTADTDAETNQQEGTLEMNNVKEFYLAITKNKTTTINRVGDVEVRVITNKEDEEKIELALETASSALKFFSNTIGNYPHKQLDVILDEGGMEYPGIITVGIGAPIEMDPESERFKHTIAHEVAHQWFYGIISNDPYYDSWIDEGITEFATALFEVHHNKKNAEDYFSEVAQIVNDSKDSERLKKVRLPLPDYYGSYYYSIYKQPIKELWELSKDMDTSLQYLKEYYSAYSYKIVDTEEFIKFTMSYYDMEDLSEFEDWINFN